MTYIAPVLLEESGHVNEDIRRKVWSWRG